MNSMSLGGSDIPSELANISDAQNPNTPLPPPHQTATNPYSGVPTTATTTTNVTATMADINNTTPETSGPSTINGNVRHVNFPRSSKSGSPKRTYPDIKDSNFGSSVPDLATSISTKSHVIPNFPGSSSTKHRSNHLHGHGHSHSHGHGHSHSHGNIHLPGAGSGSDTFPSSTSVKSTTTSRGRTRSSSVTSKPNPSVTNITGSHINSMGLEDLNHKSALSLPSSSVPSSTSIPGEPSPQLIIPRHYHQKKLSVNNNKSTNGSSSFSDQPTTSSSKNTNVHLGMGVDMATSSFPLLDGTGNNNDISKRINSSSKTSPLHINGVGSIAALPYKFPVDTREFSISGKLQLIFFFFQKVNANKIYIYFTF